MPELCVTQGQFLAEFNKFEFRGFSFILVVTPQWKSLACPEGRIFVFRIFSNRISAISYLPTPVFKQSLAGLNS